VTRTLLPVCLAIPMLFMMPVAAAAADGSAEGALRVWHPLTLSFKGPIARETDDKPNPFLDFRLQVSFTSPDGREFDVPGFFDGDGKGDGSGACWRVRFSPDRPGNWLYRASFRTGPRVAIDLAPEAGRSVSFDGASGKLAVAARDPKAPGFLRWGRLSYAGGHYLKFQDGPYWIKGGTNEPENLLAYKGFDHTVPSHAFDAHADDWRPGDPDWGAGKGKALIGLLNYLASHHVNSIYFMTMNIGGDGKDVWPWTGSPERNGSPSNDNLHYDISKLGQWEQVFAHAQRNGIHLHFVLNESEEANKRELDNGELGVERMLYYRELIARFGHHLSLQWNLCEEYNLGLDLGPDRVRRFARYVRAVDPYDHPITVHPADDPLEALAFTFGDPSFDLTSVQLNQRRIDLVTEAVREATAKAGRPLPASMDEFTVDKGTNKSYIPVDDPELYRKQKLWPTYLSGGVIEFILEGLLEVDNLKRPQCEALWNSMWHAREFLERLPFWEMRPDDRLSRGAATIAVGIGGGRTSAMGPQVLAQRGRVYAIYLPKASPTGELDLSGTTRSFTERWYNPRTGVFEGDPSRKSGGGWVPLGQPPRDPEDDWVVLVDGAD